MPSISFLVKEATVSVEYEISALALQQSIFCPQIAFYISYDSLNKQKLFPPLSGFGGLEVACWPLVPKFAGSNPAEAVGFFKAKKSSARLPSEGK